MGGYRFLRRVFGTRIEVREIATLGNREDGGFVHAFRAEVIFQFLAQVPDLHPDNIILVGAEILAPPEHLALRQLIKIQFYG